MKIQNEIWLGWTFTLLSDQKGEMEVLLDVGGVWMVHGGWWGGHLVVARMVPGVAVAMEGREEEEEDGVVWRKAGRLALPLPA